MDEPSTCAWTSSSHPSTITHDTFQCLDALLQIVTVAHQTNAHTEGERGPYVVCGKHATRRATLTNRIHQRIKMRPFIFGQRPSKRRQRLQFTFRSCTPCRHASTHDTASIKTHRKAWGDPLAETERATGTETPTSTGWPVENEIAFIAVQHSVHVGSDVHPDASLCFHCRGPDVGCTMKPIHL